MLNILPRKAKVSVKILTILYKITQNTWTFLLSSYKVVLIPEMESTFYLLIIVSCWTSVIVWIFTPYSENDRNL